MGISRLLRPNGAHAEYVKEESEGCRASHTKDMARLSLGMPATARQGHMHERQASKRFKVWKEDRGS